MQDTEENHIQEEVLSDDELEEKIPEVIEGEQINADEDLLEDYLSDTDEIACIHSKVRSLANLNLQRFSKVKTLCLRQNEITKIQALPSTLVELDLYDNLIGHIDGLSDLDLDILDLSFNRIKHIKNISHLTKLSKLYLVQNKISKIENLEGLQNLTMIELGANKIREIEGLETLTQLTELWLGKNKITHLKNLDQLSNLRILSIQSNRLTEISNLEALTQLEELYISHNGISSLTGLQPLKKLRVLDISNNKITHLTDISHMTDLVELWASNDQLSSFEEIERECKHLEQLETVYFEGNPLQRSNPTTYRNKVKLSCHANIKQIDANIIR